MYTEKSLVRIAKRENNKKRSYLVVNQLQGKHIPVKPSAALNMFRSLGDLVEESYRGERLLLAGFAETATAIGACVALRTGGCYIQTTREALEGVDYLFFSEAHSHATEQKLVRDDIEAVIGKIDRVVFVEDEVTTGNTILNIITILRNQYPDKELQFSVASLLNGMDDDHQRVFEEQNIRLHYLVKTDHSRYEGIAEQVQDDGQYVVPVRVRCTAAFEEWSAGDYKDARRLVLSEEYALACGSLWDQLKEKMKLSETDRVLVLGTEEFMYPALYVAEKIEERGNEVFFHAATRSPILVSAAADYPLHTRYELASVYEDSRTTFIYDLDQYDKVFVITDAVSENTSGMYSIINALSQQGNTDITYIRWCDN